MKIVATILCALIVGTAAMFATSNNSESPTMGFTEISSETVSAGIPSNIQGNYKNENGFIMVRDGWVRVVISGVSNEYDASYRYENGNHLLTLYKTDRYGNQTYGGAITVYPEDRRLYYNGWYNRF